jgi:hypothetical protein
MFQYSLRKPRPASGCRCCLVLSVAVSMPAMHPHTVGRCCVWNVLASDIHSSTRRAIRRCRHGPLCHRSACDSFVLVYVYCSLFTVSAQWLWQLRCIHPC